MYVVDIVFTTVFATAFGLVGAGAIAWLFWTAFKLVHRPQWGPLAALIGIVGLGYPWLRSSEVLQMLVLFSALSAGAGLVASSSRGAGSKQSARTRG